jgi:shikimate dehydrogenase
MLGSGGAAAGALAALIAAGAEVRLVARRPAVAQGIRRRFADRARRRIQVISWSGGGLGRAMQGTDGLISAVPASAFAHGAAAEGLERLPRGAAVVEMAYGSQSPLSLLVKQQGARYQDGLPMLVHQAARAVQLVTGDLPPAAPLLRAARRARPGDSSARRA